MQITEIFLANNIKMCTLATTARILVQCERLFVIYPTVLQILKNN